MIDCVHVPGAAALQANCERKLMSDAPHDCLLMLLRALWQHKALCGLAKDIVKARALFNRALPAA